MFEQKDIELAKKIEALAESITDETISCQAAKGMLLAISGCLYDESIFDLLDFTTIFIRHRRDMCQNELDKINN
jgi:hypothetical protein